MSLFLDKFICIIEKKAFLTFSINISLLIRLNFRLKSAKVSLRDFTVINFGSAFELESLNFRIRSRHFSSSSSTVQ